MAMDNEKKGREVKFIALFILVASFFGLSERTTTFFFPAIGKEVFELINFYFLVIVAFIALNERYTAQIPPVWKITVRYILAFPVFYVLFSVLIGGLELNIPKADTVIIETVVSFSENFLLLYLIPPVLHIGSYGTSLLNNVVFHIPSILLITAWHAGNYALMAGASYTDLYWSMLLALVMFTVFVIIKEAAGFGTSEAAHAGYNTALMGIRGAII